MAEEEVSKNITVFGPGTEFEGVLSYTDDLIIEGKFKGTIDATGNLTVAKDAVCDVDHAKIQSAVIFGTVNGNIIAEDRVEMCGGSAVNGDVTTARVRIANNVEFNGHVTMIDKIPETDLFSTASQEFKQAFALYSTPIS